MLGLSASVHYPVRFDPLGPGRPAIVDGEVPGLAGGDEVAQNGFAVHLVDEKTAPLAKGEGVTHQKVEVLGVAEISEAAVPTVNALELLGEVHIAQMEGEESAALLLMPEAGLGAVDE